MKDSLWGKEKRCSKWMGENIVLVRVRLSQNRLSKDNLVVKCRGSSKMLGSCLLMSFEGVMKDIRDERQPMGKKDTVLKNGWGERETRSKMSGGTYSTGYWCA